MRLILSAKDDSMAHPRLRVYYGPDDRTEAHLPCSSDAQDNRVTVPLGEVFGWLVDAMRNGKSWLRDFEDDEVTISSDLYEVIVAYQHFRRPGA
jgi:hypothetical protein